MAVGRVDVGEHRLIICALCEMSSSTGECNSNDSQLNSSEFVGVGRGRWAGR